jgi:hypothetical protein
MKLIGPIRDGHAGSAPATAAVGGDQYRCVASNNLGSATSLAASLTVTPAPQAITFAGPGDQPFSPAPITLSATADSGLPVSFAVVAGPATVAGNTLALTGAGQVTVEATQPGDADHAAAAAVDRTFTVTPNFASWQQFAFTSAELLDAQRSGPNAIYGSDDLPNLVKYALGLAPKINASGSALPATGATATNWVYTYTRPTAVTDVTCVVEVSTDLVNWTTLGVTQTLVSSANGTDTWQGSFPRGAAPSVFFRLWVSQ